MSDNNEMQNIENVDEWINWIEEAINKKHIKYYEYEHFSNIQEVGSGAFGKVFRAYWKNFENYFALKSFFNLNNVTLKEIVRELMLQRDVDFHDNIIRFYGITKFESENKIDQTKSYLLVMEYADGGTLRSYLKKNFSRLTWDNKYNLAYQLACAVLCLQEEKIVHYDLNSCNVLVHQDVIKLADFGLSKRIEEASKSKSKLLGMIPYIDPKSLMDSNNSIKLKEKFDIYSVGVLLWEISSGIPPFNGEAYDLSLMYKISQGRRETIVPNTPDDYANLYIECWNGEPNNRPSMQEVVNRLKFFISHSNSLAINQRNDVTIHIPSENISPKKREREKETERETLKKAKHSECVHKNFSIIVNEVVDLILREKNKGIRPNVINQHVLGYHNINSQEFYNWLLNNQNDSNSIFLLGYFNYYGIGTIENWKKAFSLFIIASEQDHILAQYFVGVCYASGVKKKYKLAFEYFKKIANIDYALGQYEVSCYYYGEKGIKKDLKLANYWCEKAANNGHLEAMFSLGGCYLNGDGVDQDHQKAFELYKKSAEGECLGGITMLAYCYSNGIGTSVDKQKAVELHQKAANLGDEVAQYNLALIYEDGDGIEKDINQAIYWYEQSAKQGFQKAQNRLINND